MALNVAMIENWIARNKLASAMMAILFVVSLTFQFTDTARRVCGVVGLDFCSGDDSYFVLDLMLDGVAHEYDMVSDGVFVGANVVSAEMTVAGAKAFAKAAEDPMRIFAIRVSGTSGDDVFAQSIAPAEDNAEVNTEFVLRLGSVAAARETEGQLPYEFLLYMPTIDPAYGWNGYQSEPADCCHSYFSYTAFVRLEPFRQRFQLGSTQEYRARFAEVEPRIVTKAKAAMTPEARNRHFMAQ